jgi:hypothetical protein
MGKTSLDDLVEEPSEVDEVANQGYMRSSLEEFCICECFRATESQTY